MRGVYAERQDALVAAVKSMLGGVMEVGPTGAGMHLTAWLDRGADDEVVSAQLAEAGVEAPAISRYALVRPSRGGLLLGWAAYAPEAIRTSVERMARALR